MITIVRCGNMGRSPVQLLHDWVLGASEPKCFHGKGHSVTFTDSGQSAILLAARSWGISENDEVLVPAYNCGSEISPLIATGARISMYRVDRSARIDFSDLVGRITPRTRMVLVTHYFGRPTEIQGLADICRERKIKLLEDCALSLFSDGIGHLGDAAIFSFRKSLPAVDGGVLLSREAISSAAGIMKQSSAIVSGRRALSLMKNWFQDSLWQGSMSDRENAPDRQLARPDFSSSMPDIPAAYYCHSDAVVRKASRFALGLLKRVNLIEIVQRRRDNYNYLSRRVAGVENIKFLWEDELPVGVCPLGLPVLVNDRCRWHAGLNAAGIEVSHWWEGYHRGLDWSAFPEARALKDSLLLLPVHQGLAARHMEYVGNVVRSLAAGKVVTHSS